MKLDSSRGTFQDIIRNSPPTMAKIARQLRTYFRELNPDGIEIPLPSEQHASYGTGPKMNSDLYGYICPMKDYVRLGFYYGGSLDDPEKLLQGTGKRLRHVKLYSLEQAKQPAIRALIESAVQERYRHKSGDKNV